MIPRVIHYIWFGNNPHTKLQKKCMRSWKKYCPDFEIKCWNESNFDIINTPKYVQDAYKAKKWAFVSDYVRLFVLFKEGGLYFDTDTQIIKPIDGLLHNHAFLAFEHGKMVTTGVMGAEAGNNIIADILKSFDNKLFYLPDGTINTEVTGVVTTQIFQEHGLISDGKEQNVENVHVYPFDYFYPVKVINNNTYYSEHTCIVHWFEGTWISEDNARARAHDLNPLITFFRKSKLMKLYYHVRNGGNK